MPPVAPVRRRRCPAAGTGRGPRGVGLLSSTPIHKAAFALLGIALFGFVLTRADPGQVLDAAVGVGGAGFAAVVAVYGLEFLCDVVAWQQVIGGSVRGARWTARLYLVRLAGEAFNVVTPLAGLGGEPIKAFILRHRYGLSYVNAGASLVLAKTASVLSLLLFLAAGFALMLGDGRISHRLQLMAGAGLAALTLGVAGFALVQRLRLTSHLAARMGPARRGPAGLLRALRELDQQLVNFYTTDPLRFASVLALGIANWVLGAVGVWVTLQLMQRPVSPTDAWIIEAMTQMVRAATFFIPASLGAQEGVIMLVMGVIAGDGAGGLALALVRRARELLWVLVGIGVSVPLAGRLGVTARDVRGE